MKFRCISGGEPYPTPFIILPFQSTYTPNHPIPFNSIWFHPGFGPAKPLPALNQSIPHHRNRCHPIPRHSMPRHPTPYCPVPPHPIPCPLGPTHVNRYVSNLHVFPLPLWHKLLAPPKCQFGQFSPGTPTSGRCLSGGGRGGGGLGEGSRGSRGEPPPPCRNAAYPQETAKKYYTDPFSIYMCHNNGIIMSQDRQCNSSFWVHTLCPHLNTTRKHKQETWRNVHCHQILRQRSIRVGLT